MSWIERELQELKDLNKAIDEGRINPEKALLKIAIYNQTQKRLSLLIKICALHAKGNLTPLLDNGKISFISKNPCLTCKLKDKDKNNDRCKNCDLRISYIKYIENQ